MDRRRGGSLMLAIRASVTGQINATYHSSVVSVSLARPPWIFETNHLQDEAIDAQKKAHPKIPQESRLPATTATAIRSISGLR